jgi:hypothetical protein
MEWLTRLQSLPDGFSQTAETINELDGCFLSGFANLGNRQRRTLQTFPHLFEGTPLAQPLADSSQAVLRNEFREGHFAVLAGGRAALQGAQYDSLQRQVKEAVGRPVAANPELTAEPGPAVSVGLATTRHWLMEIALAGFGRLEASQLAPYLTTLELIQAEPALARPAALLTGFITELLLALPVGDTADIPLHRWTDLWTRAMASALGQARPAATPISGTLYLLGVDIRHHSHLISLVAYGLLENAEGMHEGRLTLSAYKVGAIPAEENWLLFPQAALLFQALAGRRTLQLDSIPRLPTGDLLWNGAAILGAPFNPLEVAARYFAPAALTDCTPTALAPADRHPVQLAEPIFLDGYAVEQREGKVTLAWGETAALPVAMERLHPLGLTAEVIGRSTQLFGLLRFDAGCWSVQPLAVSGPAAKGKGKVETIMAGDGAAAVLAKPPKNSVVAILQERAGRLLRKN